jgi:uncharacterized membrane protein YsdA (DUF1294 family)/cold shock CspA family protein
MRFVGRITEWNDARGFGFVVPNGGGERAFLHIKSFDRPSARPYDDALVSYEISVDERRRPQATAVRFASGPADRRRSRHALAWRSVVGMSALLLLVIAAIAGRLPMLLAATYGIASVVAFAMYGVDKSAARNDRWRTPEQSLHFIGLLGGWPGALLAQDVFRHKSRKLAFQVAFWICIIANLAIVGWLLKTGHVVAIERAVRGLIRDHSP